LSFADARGPALPFGLAVGISALAPPAMLALFDRLGRTLIEANDPNWRFVVTYGLSALVIALVAGLVGLPLTRRLARSRNEEPWVYPVAGSLVGGFLLIGFEQSIVYTFDPALLLVSASLGAVPGGLCGALWWFLYRRHAREGQGG
jgi:hypothetical protein